MAPPPLLADKIQFLNLGPRSWAHSGFQRSVVKSKCVLLNEVFVAASSLCWLVIPEYSARFNFPAAPEPALTRCECINVWVWRDYTSDVSTSKPITFHPGCQTINFFSLLCKNQIFKFFWAFKFHISPRPNLILLPKCYCEIKTILGRLWGIFYFSDAGVWRQNGYNIFVERYGRFCQTIWLKSVKFVKFVSFVSFALVTWPDCDI